MQVHVIYDISDDMMCPLLRTARKLEAIFLKLKFNFKPVYGSWNSQKKIPGSVYRCHRFDIYDEVQAQ